MKLFLPTILSTAMGLSFSMNAMAQSSPTPANIGEFTAVSGNVLIERNGEFYNVASDSGILANDRVVALEESSANISFAGCDMALPASQSVSILAAQSCADTFELTSLEVGDPAREASIASLDLAGVPNEILALAAIGVAVGIIAIIDDGDDDDDAPASP